MIKKIMLFFDMHLFSLVVVVVSLLMNTFCAEDKEMSLIKFFSLMALMYSVFGYLKICDLEREIRRGKIDSIVLAKLNRGQNK